MDKQSIFLKSLREKHKLSQKEICDTLDISRTSYFQIEKGKKKLSFDEASKLCSLYGISLEELSNAQVADYAKYKDMIKYFVKKFKNGVPKTKLAKLTYLSDFSWYYNQKNSISGMLYRKIQYGPVPDIYFLAIEELQREGYIKVDTYPYGDGYGYSISPAKILTLTEPEKISEKESNWMHEVFKNWKNSSTAEIVAFTHAQKPYRSAKMGEIVSYDKILEETDKAMVV